MDGYHEQRPPGWGVRMPGWQSDGSESEESNMEDAEAVGEGSSEESEVPEVVERPEEYQQLNNPEFEVAHERNSDSSSADSYEPAPKRHHNRHESSREEKKREEREQKRERKRQRRERREREWEERFQRRSTMRSDTEDVTIATLWKSWAMPKLRDEMTHDEMRLEWPIWRDMLTSALELQSPPGRKWTEEEKYMTLMMHGGKNVRETASFTAPVSGEVPTGEDGKEPKFNNLITRCNVTYRARDPTMEITVLRNMIQRKDESVREFLEKARRQISLCGYNTGAERDRELIMLLKQNTIDAITISKHGIGQNLEQMEALAINLEAIRQREQRQAGDDGEKVGKPEIDIHAVMDKFNQWSKTNTPGSTSFQQNQSGYSKPQSRERGDCNRCGRKGGHEEGWKCRATTMECYTCGRSGHLSAVCRQARGIKEEPFEGRQHSQQKGRIHKVSGHSRGRAASTEGREGNWET